MNRAAFVTIQLARFDTRRVAGALAEHPGDLPGVLFHGVAADTRAAATTPASQEAYTFLILGLHADDASAHRLLDERPARAPWLAEARETWAAVLQPYRQRGAANYLDPAHPGPLFDHLAPPPDPTAPFVVVTSVGWEREGLDMNRVQAFGEGVLGVRTSMTGNPGLHSQQTFFFPGVLKHDPATVTFWRDDASVSAFAYGPGIHRDQVIRDRAEGLSDRTSSARLRALRSEGAWYGEDPLAFPAGVPVNGGASAG